MRPKKSFWKIEFAHCTKADTVCNAKVSNSLLTLVLLMNRAFELRYKRADDYSLSLNLKVVCVCMSLVCILCVGSQKRMDFFRGGETNSSSFILYTQIQKSKSI